MTLDETQLLFPFFSRQLYDVAIQAVAQSRIVARETVKAVRKDVTAKCHGGDITRKKKLLDKQKEGKKKMRMVGTVELPKVCWKGVVQLILLIVLQPQHHHQQEAFLTVLSAHGGKRDKSIRS